MLRHASVRLVTLAVAMVIAPATSWGAPHQRGSARRRVQPVHRRTAPAHNRSGAGRKPMRKRTRSASATAPTALGHASELLRREPTIPFMVDEPAPSLPGRAFSEHAVATVRNQLTFVGVIEAPARDMRLAVIAVDGRIVHGQVGDVLDGRYRISAFTAARAELIDVATDEAVSVDAAIGTDASRPAAAPAPAGALRVVGEPEFAEIFVDGAYVGTVADMNGAPEGVPLEAGPHHVDLLAAEHEPVRVAVRITPNRTTTYRVALSKERQ